MSDKEALVMRTKMRASQLFGSTERQNVNVLWSELAEYMLNNQFHNFTVAASGSPLVDASTTTPGTKKTQNLFDSTALQAVQELAAAFQGTLTNPATTWSQMKFRSDALNDDAQAARWLQEANDVIHSKINDSNFNTEIAKAYQSFVAFGSMALLVEEKEDAPGDLRFTSLHLGQIAWADDKHGIVNTVFRNFEYTAQQAVERWGTSNSEEILEAAEKTPDKKFTFLHAIFPRNPNDVKVNEVGLAKGENRPIASLYIDCMHNHLVSETGYYEMPVLVGRWSLTPGETIGRGPGHYALPDTRTVNRLVKRQLQAADYQINPPILANQRDVLGPLKMSPKSVNIVKDINGIKEFETRSRTDVIQFTKEELKESIRSIFFLDKLLLPPRTETGEMTAFEVDQRLIQMNRVLGPVVSRVDREILSPMIIRIFKIVLRAGVVPPLPDILAEAGVNIDVVFVNQLAQTQQLQELQTIQQWVRSLGELAQLDPTVLDVINADGVARLSAREQSLPQEVIRSTDEVEQIRQARQQQAEQAQALQAGVQLADIQAKTNPQGNGE